jgi:hypothetical protein
LTPTLRASCWTVLAGGVGYAASAVFSGLLQWDRALFIVPYALMVVTFFLAYVKWGGIDLRDIARRHRIRGLLGGIVVGLILIRGVTAQPASTRPEGGHSLLALVWLGVVYGAIDALLLNVVPVLIVYQSVGKARKGSWFPPARRAMLALAASLFVTAAYHLGYAEFQGPALIQPLIGNTIVTVGYLLTSSPVAALVAHVTMHLAAVLHGMETTVQLPPHY